jgi:hypothetical protein
VGLASNAKKRVLIWNPISNHGHLNSYLFLYTKILTNLGYKVEILADLDSSTYSRILEDFPHVVIFGREVNEVKSEKKSFYFWLGNLITKMIPRSRNSGQFRLSWRPLIDHLNDNLDTYSLVINMYLDPMSEDMQELSQLSKIKTYWIGLLFHPKQKTLAKAFITEPYFDLENNLGALFFTQESVNFYNQIFPKFQFAPDLATSEFDENQNSFEDDEFQTIIERFVSVGSSAKVKTIAMVGSIGPSKMISEFVDFALACQDVKYRFAIIGEVHFGNLGSLDKQALERFKKAKSPRYFFANHYIQSDRDYNYLFSKVDFIFAGYRDWYSSNNFLAKASILKKPILTVPNGSLAVAVGMNGIGLISESARPDSLIKCLENLDLYNEMEVFEGSFSEYSEKTSEEHLVRVLSDFLDRILQKH